MRRCVLAVCLAAMPWVGGYAAEMTAEVVSVSEGDTLVVQDSDQRQHTVKLSGIDAPELLQAFGRKSRFSLKDMVYLKQVRLVAETFSHKTIPPSSRQAVSAQVFVGEIDVGKMQLLRGMAWAADSDDLDYVEAENMARAQRKGIWRDREPTPPWLWRCC